jgi:hypothetical protein
MARNHKSPIRFTAGEYQAPPAGRDPLYYYREDHRFAWLKVLQAIEKRAPKVVTSLARQVLPAYKRAIPHLGGVTLTDPQTLDALTRQPTSPPEFHDLKRALTRWAQRWRLNESGLLVRSLETLHAWHCQPRQGRRQWCIQHGPDSPQSCPHVALVQFVVQAWHPRTEPRQAAEKRIQEELRRQTRKYLDHVEAEAQQRHGLVKSPVKTEENHFEWFVRYQVLGESLSSIAEGGKTDPPTVQRAVDGVGRLLSGPHWPAWKRPPGKSGPRPGKS